MSDQQDIAISIKDVHKNFILPQSKHTSFKQVAVNIVKKNKKVTQKVLDGVSFDIHKGDFFGIVGRNGSGKSTLLKLIAGVYTPTSGTIEINGGLTPFIELGVGFNPELSGQDNVYLNGALLGFTRKQMDEMYDEIVDFAELEPFMGQKLKNYSSGMQVRLAFSIAIKAKNEILIFDEVLAVGDEAFQRKCLDVFEGYKASGQTVILVTHDMETVKTFCNKAVLISEGKIIDYGNPRKIADKYSVLNQNTIDREVAMNNHSDGQNDYEVKISDINGKDRTNFEVNETLSVHLDWSRLKKRPKSIGVNIFKQSGEHVTGANTIKDGFSIKSRTSARINIKLPVQPGKYYILAEAYEDVGKLITAKYDGAPQFTVKGGEVEWSGMVALPHDWSQ